MFGSLPIGIELVPSIIFDSPSADHDESGFDMGANFVWYPGGNPLRGFWVKAHAEFEVFKATLSRNIDGQALGKPDPNQCDADSATGTCSKSLNSWIFGLILGTTQVFGKNGGFAISGGIGLGVAIADPVSLSVLPCTAQDVADKDPHCASAEAASATGITTSYYQEEGRIRLLGSLSLGVAF